VYDEFKDKLLNYIEKHTVVGDPFDLRTTLGPIGMKKGLIQLRQ
jgi:acyl-CoA reductase-like NAD-dependent aldehyde dehydrogenase